jgi:hypothetical protein
MTSQLPADMRPSAMVATALLAAWIHSRSRRQAFESHDAGEALSGVVRVAIERAEL